MKNAIIELLDKADERKLRLIYIHVKAMVGDDAEHDIKNQRKASGDK